ncbi:MAG: WYL domain-containing protein, partial [Clostridia bacterium]|nr:WYL domain-containing protein [Clostridia bacterium]
FGKDTRITKLEDGSFEASFVTAPEGFIYWALQYMQHVEVLEPQHVRDKVVEAIKNNRYGV